VRGVGGNTKNWIAVLEKRRNENKFKMPISEEDKPVYDQVSGQIITYLKERGDYDPAVDNIFIDTAVHALIQIRFMELKK